MKHLTKYYAGLLLAGSVFLASCFNEGADMCGKSDVNMTFTSRSADGTADEGEGMKRLRVIMATSGGNVLHEEAFDITPEGTASTIKFHDVPNDTYTFYVVANEASVPGIKFEDLKGLENTVLDTAPDTYVGAGGIPMAAVRTESISSSSSHTIEIFRAVSKICVTFKNETEAEQTLKNVSVLNMKTENGFLFPNDILPEGTESLSLPADGTEITISAGGEKMIKCYTYPNQKEEGYTLTAEWNGQQFTEQLKLKESGEALNKVERNDQINLTVTLTGNPNYCIQVNTTVKPWEIVELPPTFE